MSESPMFSTMVLPPELVADDVIGLRDQMSARIAAVLRPKGGKRKEGDAPLPKGVEPVAALPPHIDRPWKRFDAAATELQGFRGLRASTQADQRHAAPSEAERSAANTGSDDRWRALEQWNAGAAGLSDDGEPPSPSEARWLYGQLFPAPEGLRFITRRPRIQWAAMVQRMKTLEEERAQAVIEQFGGTRHYQQLVASHARFGEAYGFTTVVLAREGGPTDGRPQWSAARDALRSLIQKIENHADPDIPGSETLAAFLLAPYVEMVDDLARSRRKASAKKPEAISAPPFEAGGTP
ncbi:hypothetical protein sce3200 [Sorangium cellulosum So ce56]|uniref:Uncharacterized protein n=1 Tax=Sorangium cellulosum (strain So ce56) TaxID=448385 RepID=A9GJ59_SORC5|nr:hypothetical protein [Sorangium cellulosum]CAN93359.1 hypothetical protein sce3200 [Sorangium cellulosum So ce56]